MVVVAVPARMVGVAVEAGREGVGSKVTRGMEVGGCGDP